MVCASESITSNNDISYGGVDEDGSMDPASRRYTVWDDEEHLNFNLFCNDNACFRIFAWSATLSTSLS